MGREVTLWQELMTFLFQTVEGRGLLSTIFTALVGLFVRLAIMGREAQIERDEFIRLEKQDELEREIMDLKRRLDDLGLLVQEEE